MEKSSVLRDLPEVVASTLSKITEISSGALGDDLVSIVLYGSAAEGKMRATSDVNILFIFSAFNMVRIDGIREQLRIAQSSVRLSAMFLLESEITLAAESFAVKFSDIIHRHRILYGKDCFADLAITRDSQIHRLRQVLLNLALRLRESYVMSGLREEQLSKVIADAASPLRTSAAMILELEGRPAPSPKEALESICKTSEGERWKEAVQSISIAREGRILPPGTSGDTLFSIIEICNLLRERVNRIS